MKTKYFLIIYILTSLAAFAQVNVTGFGSGQISVQSATTFTLSQTATDLTISGANDQTGVFQALFPTVDITAFPNLLSLTGTINGSNPSSNFTLQLYDGSVFRDYNGNWGSFTSGSSSTVSLTYNILTSDPSFVLSSVQGMVILFAGSGNSVNFTFDNLAATSAIPEPATYAALFGAASLGLAVWRKRRKSA